MNKPTFWLCGLLLTLAGSAWADSDVIGRATPDCALASLNEAAPVDLQQLRGSVAYVDFWASWCSPCAKSFPFMNELQRDYGERGLHIVGINLDEDADSAQRFLSAHPAHFSVAADRSSQCPRAFAVTAMPTAYLIDRRGIVRHVFVGFKAGGEAVIRQEIEHMLADTTDKN